MASARGRDGPPNFNREGDRDGKTAKLQQHNQCTTAISISYLLYTFYKNSINQIQTSKRHQKHTNKNNEISKEQLQTSKETKTQQLDGLWD